MIIVKQNIIPFKGFSAITLWPFVFVRKDCEQHLKESKQWDTMLRHEQIHLEQQREMLIIPFFLWYIVEWLLRKLFGNGNAYRNICFEREAYRNDDVLFYIEHRDPFNWVNYLKD